MKNIMQCSTTCRMIGYQQQEEEKKKKRRRRKE
jgi:hypothetical protein